MHLSCIRLAGGAITNFCKSVITWSWRLAVYCESDLISHRPDARLFILAARQLKKGHIFRIFLAISFLRAEQHRSRKEMPWCGVEWKMVYMTERALVDFISLASRETNQHTPLVRDTVWIHRPLYHGWLLAVCAAQAVLRLNPGRCLCRTNVLQTVLPDKFQVAAEAQGSLC